MADMTHSNVWHDSFINGSCSKSNRLVPLPLRDTTLFNVWHDSLYVWHCSSFVTWLDSRDRRRRAATHCTTLQQRATHCNTLQHTATHCNALRHTATHCNSPNCRWCCNTSFAGEKNKRGEKSTENLRNHQPILEGGKKKRVWNRKNKI